ncbi:MAG: NADPH2:quinone reductase [Woeseiaceae bacterium]|jgi:NADPH2:quinone reductase|tara:strand:- start:29981 stop:30964 length:984 start_codon:yes stop_codon:yes gene_type:complete
MRALICKKYGPPNELCLELMDDPVPKKGQLLVNVKAAGINFPDVLAIEGKYQVKTEPPFVPGNEAAGVVEAIGDDVTQFKPGDHVIVTSNGGAFAEKCIVDENASINMIPELNFSQGAGFMVTYGTSYHALHQAANIQKGETLLVLGAAGGVGITAVEIAKAKGARVIAAASSDDKLAFAREAGADDLINYSEMPLKETVKELTQGKGVDVVYDPVGGKLADEALRATAWHGRYLVIGFACGDIPKFPANILLLKEASIIGVWWGTWAAKNPKLHFQNLKEISTLIKTGRLNPKITEQYPIEQYQDAFKVITERRAKGKVVLTMTDH